MYKGSITALSISCMNIYRNKLFLAACQPSLIWEYFCFSSKTSSHVKKTNNKTRLRHFSLLTLLVFFSFFLLIAPNRSSLLSVNQTNPYIKPYFSKRCVYTCNTRSTIPRIPTYATNTQSSILTVKCTNLTTNYHANSSFLSPEDVDQRIHKLYLLFQPAPLVSQQPPKCRISFSCVVIMILVTMKLAKSVTPNKSTRSTPTTPQVQRKDDDQHESGNVQPKTKNLHESGKVHSHTNFKRFEYNKSLKNIPIPPKDSYMKLLLAKTFDVIERIRWKVFFYLNPEQQREDVKTFGFRTAKSAPKSKELEKFEDDLIELVSNPKFKESRPNCFQKELLKNVKEINNSKDVFLLADKTTNIYKISPEHYNKFLIDNITKDYKKAPKNSVLNTNIEAKDITDRLKISERVEVMSEQPAYITLKDHKENFENAPKFRLINPAKSQIGKISKQKLDDINSSIRDKLQLQQWKNTHSALSWFENIKYKKNKSFLQFDIVEFYPSISEKLLKDALKFASKISPQLVDSITIEIILHARKAFLFSENYKESTNVPNSVSNVTQWTKKSGFFLCYHGCIRRGRGV